MRNADLAAGPEPETEHDGFPLLCVSAATLLQLAVLVDHANAEMRGCPSSVT